MAALKKILKAEPYWTVWLSPANHLMRSQTYAFPSEDAALKFAKAHRTSRRKVKVYNRYKRLIEGG